MNDNGVLISIIIPCFNQGHFIQEAIDSVDTSKINYPVEIIIVDDGSTDINTLNKLDELNKQNYQVIHQINKGPAAARNAGIRLAQGKYILPLDADNIILPDYINKSVPILEEGIYSIVYAKPYFFGRAAQRKRKFAVAEFDITKMVKGNYIDNCAIYHKKVWVKNNGYDEAIPFYGHEDWEFWINASSNKFRFYFLKEHLFYYRIEDNSVVTTFVDNTNYVRNHQYISKKHAAIFLEQLVKLVYLKSKYDRDIKRFLLTPFIFPMYLLKILKSPWQKAQKKFSFYDEINKD